MNREDMNTFVPKIKAWVARKDTSLNMIVPLTSGKGKDSVEVSKTPKSSGNTMTVIPMTSAICENMMVFQMTSPNCEKNLEVQITSSKSVLDLMTISNCETKEKTRVKRNENCVFRSILFIALILGVPVAPEMLFPKRRRLIKFLKRYNSSVFYIRTVFLIIESFYNYVFWPSLALRYSIHCSCLIGYATVLFFHIKRREVKTALMEMTRLSSDLNPDDATPFIRCYKFFCLCCWVSFWSLSLYFFFYIYWDISSEKITSISSMPEGTTFTYAYCWLVTFAEVTTYHVGSATVFVTTLLCCRSYLLLAEFVRLFGEKLKNDVSGRPLQNATVSRNLKSFKLIFFCSKAVDNALCVFSFLIYMDVINNIYVVMSTLLSGEKKYQATEVSSILSIIGLGATLKFLYLTLSGDLLGKRHDALKNDLIEMSDCVLRKSFAMEIHGFNLISANVRTVDIRVTSMGYFKITRLIIPSAISIMITYGVMIYQIRATADLGS